MKQILITLFALIGMSLSIEAQTWNGSVNTNWNEPLNWTPSVVPGATSNITLNGSGFSPKLQGNTSVGAIAGASGVTLDVNGFSLTVGGIVAYTVINGATFINTNPVTDIILNINTGSAGYYSQFTGCSVNDKITFNVTGNNEFYEGGSANTYNGDVVMNVNGSATVYTSYTSVSQINGNFNYTRTVGGSSYIFNQGGAVTGNVNIQHTAGGLTSLGYTGSTATINGTLTMNITDPSPASFSMTRIKNQTTGGTINVQNSLGLNIQNDTLKVASFTVQGYEGNAYAFFLSNMIEGNVIMEDDVAYSSGYDTRIYSNQITGNLTFTLKGNNTLNEAATANTGNIYNGNTVFNLNGGGTFYMSHGDTSIFNGNLTINRTLGGYNRVFNSGATINGNFTYNNTATGDNDLGNISNPTAISGTVNMNVNLVAIARFEMYRLINQVAGGKINVKNPRGFDVQRDSLKVDSLNVIGYRGNAYGYFIDNQINGHVTLSDSASFGSGYNTQIRNSTIIGNTTFNIYGTNEFYEGHTAASTYTGNLNINALGSGSLYTSVNAKSSVSGNFTVNRTVAGYTRLFANGATIGGNFSYTKNAAGASDLGLISNKTTIAGTINLNVTQTISDEFSFHRIQNSTTGGSILVNNPRGFNVQQDSILVTSFSILGYGGSQYGYLLNNQITGNLTLQDIASYGGGYNTSIHNNIINGNSIFTILGTNTFNEANVASSANTFNGNVTYNCDGLASLYTSHGSKSNFNGNLTINRTIAGHTQGFNAGATITGNFSYTKNAAGVSVFGHPANKTLINGTINMNVTQTTASDFGMYRIHNLTNGGSILVNSTKGFDIQKDSLLVSSFSIIGYGGSEYAYFLSNQLTGNLTLQDIASYGGGYNTSIHSNTINGNSSFTILGTNTFNEANVASTANTFNGNVTFNCDGGASLYSSHGSKSNFNGNLTINRTIAGHTQGFNAGATITGNFSYTKNAAGVSVFGHVANKTLINGTINMNVTQTTASDFGLYRIQNLTNGGSILVNSTKGFDIQKDSLLVSSFSIIGYGGSEFGYLLSNQITGNLTLQDIASYGGGHNTSIHSNTINGNSSFTILGTNLFNDANIANSGNTYLGNVTYTRIGTGIMNIGTVDTNSYGGNFVLNNTAALPINTELIKFIGSSNSNIDQLGTGTINIQKFILNKTAAAKVTLNKPVIVSTSCAFLTGYISSTSANPLIFLDNINHNSTSDNSHVIGYVTKVGNDAFLFPLGNGIGYHPLGISAPGALTDSFQAGIILNHPSDDGYNVNSKDAALVQIAPYHYWTLAQISGTNSEAVSLGWSIPCANTVIANLPGMAVARWNGTQWNNLGNSATAGTTSLGTVTQTGTTANFGTFALATTSALNSWQITSVTASASTVCAGTPTTLTGAGAATYNWQPGNLTGTSVAVTPLTTTTYTVTGTSATGCITTATKTIIVNPVPPTGTTASATVICVGSSVTLTGTGANTYTWMPGSLSGTSVIVSPASTTTYTVTGTFTATGCTKTATRTITVNPLPAVSTTASATTICAGASTTITAANANTYVWQPGGSTANPLTVTPASTTTYTVTGINTATGCTNTSTRTITVNPLPAVSTSASATTLCAGASTTITAANANTYVWQPGGSTTNPLVVAPASTTTYTVTGTNTATGCTNTSTRLITVNPLPAVSTSASATTLCAGASTTITAANSNTYVWQPGGSTTNPLVVAPASTTTYTVTGTNTATGCTNTSTRLITVNALPAVSTSASATTLCAGASTTITAANANTYVWQPGGSTTNPLVVAPASTTTYTVTGTNTATGCTNTSTRLITVNALPAVSTSASATSLCAGASTTITAANANTYVWQPGGSTANPLTVTPASTTTYTVTGTNTATGCTKTATRLITVNPLPSVGTTVTASTVCSGVSTTITGTGANTYTWNPGALSGSSITVTPPATTTYTVTGTNTATGCTNSSTRLITVTNCTTTVNLKLFIEGYYKGGSLMESVLFNQGVSANIALTDTIEVELRNMTSPYGVVASKKVILNTNGTAACLFTPFVSGTYYIAVKHRNAVQTWSSTGVTVGAAPVTYDFSNAITKAYGSNQSPVGGGVFAFFSGDFNSDENIDLGDLSLLEADITNFQFGYFATDLNGDGNVDILDSPLEESNIINFVFSNHP